MADPKTAQAHVTPADAGKKKINWVEDERSLPMYRALECDNATIEGWLVDCCVLGKPGIDPKTGKSSQFKAFVVLLTAPCVAFVDDEKTTIPAGKEIYIHGADIRDLDKYALDPKHVHQFRLQPTGKKMKLPGGFSMPTWKRMRNPEPGIRAEISPNRLLLANPSVIAKQLAQTTQDADFEPSELE